MGTDAPRRLRADALDTTEEDVPRRLVPREPLEKRRELPRALDTAEELGTIPVPSALPLPLPMPLPMPGVNAPRPVPLRLVPPGAVPPLRAGLDLTPRLEERGIPAPGLPAAPKAPRVEAAEAEVVPREPAEPDVTALERKLGRQGAVELAARDAASAAREVEPEIEGREDAAPRDAPPDWTPVRAGWIDARAGWIDPRAVPGAVSAEDRLAPPSAEGVEETEGIRVADRGVDRDDPEVVEP